MRTVHPLRPVTEEEEQAAQEAVYKSGDSVNQWGLPALLIAPGRERKETYTLEQRERIVQEFRRVPDREENATATWSLMTLRKQALPKVGASTIREVLHEAGYGKTRTWCPTGTAVRMHKAGTVTVQDPKAPRKKTLDRARLLAGGRGRLGAVVLG